MSTTDQIVPPSDDQAAAGRRRPLEPTRMPSEQPEPPAGELVVEELLVEDISIDGMCGVY